MMMSSSSSSSSAPRTAAPAAVVMRAPKITTITTQSYQTEYWPKISAAVIEILMHPEKQIMQEELYRTVYNVCCQRHQPRLYEDTLKLVRGHLAQMRVDLLAANEQTFFSLFSRSFVRFHRAVDILCVGFRYLERSYVLEKATTLMKVFNDTYTAGVLQPPDEPPEVKRRLQITLQHFTPPIPDPTTTMHLIKGLYALNKEYASFNPFLFAMYIPCLQPPRGLEDDRQETLAHLRILTHQGIPRGEGRRKRTYDDFLSL